MQPICLSISHHNTPVELRECLSLSAEWIEDAAHAYPLRAGSFETLKEMVILSTCNRLEIYAVAALPDAEQGQEDKTLAPLRDYLDTAFHIPFARVQPYITSYAGIQAVEHLFRVTAGWTRLLSEKPRFWDRFRMLSISPCTWRLPATSSLPCSGLPSMPPARSTPGRISAGTRSASVCWP